MVASAQPSVTPARATRRQEKQPSTWRTVWEGKEWRGCADNSPEESGQRTWQARQDRRTAGGVKIVSTLVSLCLQPDHTQHALHMTGGQAQGPGPLLRSLLLSEQSTTFPCCIQPVTTLCTSQWHQEICFPQHKLSSRFFPSRHLR